MSSTNKKENAIVITPDDCKAAIEFWKHFKIDMPEELQKAFSDFIATPTLENQLKVKFQLTKSIATSDHEAFKDEMFEQVVAECAAVAYEMSFDNQLEETLESKD